MRLLHTSDWHLGRSFGQVSRLDDQARFCDWLVELAVAERVELVVVAGDLYDRAIPPVEAVALLRTTFARLAGAGIKVVAIAGNHDSPERVAAADGLTDAAGVIVRGGYARAADTVTFELADGPLDVVAVPYLDPLLAPDPDTDIDTDTDLETEDVAPDGEPDAEPGRAVTTARRTHRDVLADAIGRAPRRSPRSIAVAHAFVAGGQPSESERELGVGGSGRVGADLFGGFSYVALGHLHTPQVLNRTSRRYSGSPLAYSFSETDPKQVVIAELTADGAATVTEVPVPIGRPVAVLRGRIDDLLASSRHDAVEQNFVRAVLTDDDHVLDAKLRLQRRFPFVVEILLEPTTPAVRAGAADRHRLRLTPTEAATAFWADVTGRSPHAAERAEIDDVLAGAALGEGRR